MDLCWGYEEYFYKKDDYYYCNGDDQYPICKRCVIHFPLERARVMDCGKFTKCICHNQRLADKKAVDHTFRDWTYVTISPSKARTGGLGLKDEKALERFGKLWFAPYNWSEYFWVIEYGKSEEDAHLHIHALVKGARNKTFGKEGTWRCCMKEWNKTMPVKLTQVNSWIEKQANKKIDADILHQRINDKELWTMKYNYLFNDLKGTHQNFSGGTLGVISSN